MGQLSAEQIGRRLAVLPSDLLEDGRRPSGLQPLAGRLSVVGDAVCFAPRFPFVAGTRYALLFEPAADDARAGQPEAWQILRPAPDATPVTTVLAIYPSGDELPVNLLKLYLHFSGAMSEGWAVRAVGVRRADDGAPLDGVFLASSTELWDHRHRRLTLLLDPGRIKRGLVPNVKAGYPLQEGVAVVVAVDAAFHDAEDRPLCAGLERRFRVGPPLRSRVEPRAWDISRPRAGTREPLLVTFDRPLDRALLDRCLWVHGQSGAACEGRAVTGASERSWRFEPRSPWSESAYLLLVDPRLEDLAGNSLVRVFDRDLTSADDAPAATGPVAVAFRCGSRAET